MKKIIIILLMFAVISSGCKKIGLYNDLSEEDANTILVLLNEHDIKASKVKEVRQNEVFWTIEVAEDKISEARGLLAKNNLPRKRELGFTGVYKDASLIPTPDEQRARYVLALKGELINSLYKMPEVVNADVVINVPTKSEFETEAVLKPTASVILRVRSTANARAILTESKIQQFVANAVEGLNPRDVSVIISYIEEAKAANGMDTLLTGPMPDEKVAPDAPQTETILGIEVTKDAAKKFKLILVVILLFLLLLSAALILTIVKFSRKDRNPNVNHGVVEGNVIDEDRQLGGPSR